MSVAPDAYSLPAVMSSVWSRELLSEQQKHLISACLPEDVVRPTSEEQLAKLQEIVGACEVLLSVRPTNEGHWLSVDGQNFPDAIHRFSFEVARQMFTAKYLSGEKLGQPCALPGDFVETLTETVRQTQSHVATLNYDGLLSSAFERSGMFSTDEMVLRDGFIDAKFDKSHLFRQKERGGWYLHLHGSPLFVDREKSRPHKLVPTTLLRDTKSLKNVGKHVVLTHAAHKQAIINASEVLKTYWEFLKIALQESTEIVLFGYSGNDIHLNQLIAQRRGEKTVKVVEWLGAGYADVREPFWKDQLGGEADVILKEDVLDFEDW